jgi:hypothetical protein
MIASRSSPLAGPHLSLSLVFANTKQRHFPIRKLIPGMFGIAPGATNRASLQTNKNGSTPVK